VIDNLKPYPEYKDSGLPWLGQIPAHWKCVPLWTVARLKSDIGQPKLGLLSVYLDRGVIPYSEGGGLVHAPSLDLSKYQVVQPGDLVLNNQQAWRGSVGVSRYTGIVSPAYVVFALSDCLQSIYSNYLFRSPAMVDQFRIASRGVGTIQRNIYPPSLRVLTVPVPALEEQDAIVCFLDHANRQIDRYIRVKKRMIVLLNEQKQAIIHQAVTRGLDPNVSLKPSGIPWLSDIPAHWEMIPAKHIFREVDERSRTGDEELLSVSHLTGVSRRSEKNITMFMASSYIGHKLCKPSDLVINTMWAWMAALGVSKLSGIISPAYAVYRPINPTKHVDEFVDMLLRTRPYISEYICRSTGIRSSRLRLYPEQFLKIPLIVPPVTDQRAIIEFVSRETEGFNRLITRTEREITLMREYRTRLIADVVTGQLDVRTAATHLPAATDLSTTTDVDISFTDEAELTADDLDLTSEETAP